MAQKSNFIVRGGLDMSGFQKGLSQTQKQLSAFQTTISKSMKLVATAIGSVAIGSLVKDSIKAASDLEGAYKGLESIVKGQGRNYSEAKNFINDYVKDGLVPLTDAVTAYKNLTARGYDDEQIKNVMNRLKDAASFGRQASYSLGEAVKSATEGLKNENSILVDNAGVTKNVSKMWEEYAKSIGKTRNELTQQEKIQAEVNGIMQETQWQVGDAQKYTDTFAGRLAKLNKTFTDIKVNIGNAFMPIGNIVLPLLQSMADKVSLVTNTLSQFSQALFGKAFIASTTNTEIQADTIEDLGDAAEKAGKQASKAIAPFDELNKVSFGSGSSSGAIPTGGITNPVVNADEINTNNGILQSAEELKAKLKPLTDSLKNLWDALKPLATAVGQGFVDFVKQLWNIGKDALSGWIPSGINSIANALKKIDPSSMEKIGTGLGKIGLFFGGLKMVTGLAKYIKEVATGIMTLTGSVSNFAALNPMAFVVVFNDLFEGIDEALWNIAPQWIKDFWTGFWDSFAELFKKIFSYEQTFALFRDMIDLFKRAFSGQSGNLVDIGIDIIDGILTGITAAFGLIMEPIINFFDVLIKNICDVFGISSPAKKMKPYGAYIIQGLVEGIKEGWSNLWKNFMGWLSAKPGEISTAFGTLTNYFKTKGGQIISGIKEGWNSGWSALKTWLGTIPNKIASSIGSLFEVGKNLLNTFIKGLQSISLPKLNVSIGTDTKSIFGKEIQIPKLDIGWYANGGFPKAGELFVGNENGIEMMGQMGNRNVVANNNQIVDGIREGVRDGNAEEVALLKEQNILLRGILEKTGITSKEVFKAVRSENDVHRRVTGQSAFV